MSTVSREVEELLRQKSLDAAQFEQCYREFRDAHNSRMMTHYVLAAVCFGTGLWALASGLLVVAVALLMGTLFFNHNSSNYWLMVNIWDGASILAMRLKEYERTNESQPHAHVANAT